MCSIFLRLTDMGIIEEKLKSPNWVLLFLKNLSGNKKLFYPKIISLFNFFYFSYIMYTGDLLFCSNFEFVSFYIIIPQYQNGIGIYLTFNLLRRLFLYYVLYLQIF